MAKSKGPKFYAVAKGRNPGIYNSWAECESQVKGFSGAIFKSFKTRPEAESFMTVNSSLPSSTTSSSRTDNVVGYSNNVSNTSSSALGKKRTIESLDEEENTSNKRLHVDNAVQEFSVDVTIYFDGGSRGNPGIAGAGAEVKVGTKENCTIYRIRQFCGCKQTNNFAEYTGLIIGLKQAIECLANCAKNTSLPCRVRIYGDSNLVVQQVNGCWQCKNDNIRSLYNEARRLYANIRDIIGEKGTLSLQHVYREQNKIADELGNEAMDQKRSWTTSSVEIFGGAERNQSKTEPVRKPAAARNNKVIELGDSDDESVVHC
eukprot:scaffold15231_cov66-Cyclotella_meneghiniana.AAC.8